MGNDGVAPQRLRVDGGMARNDWFLQFMADVLGVEVVRPKNVETTVLGAAILAAVGAGEFASLEETASVWKLDRKFEPKMVEADRKRLMAGWNGAIARVKG
jgi:glycerol kinase